MSTPQRIRIVVEEYRDSIEDYEERQDYIVPIEDEIDGYNLALTLTDHANKQQRIVRSLVRVGSK